MQKLISTPIDPVFLKEFQHKVMTSELVGAEKIPNENLDHSDITEDDIRNKARDLAALKLYYYPYTEESAFLQHMDEDIPRLCIPVTKTTDPLWNELTGQLVLVVDTTLLFMLYYQLVVNDDESYLKPCALRFYIQDEILKRQEIELSEELITKYKIETSEILGRIALCRYGTEVGSAPVNDWSIPETEDENGRKYLNHAYDKDWAKFYSADDIDDGFPDLESASSEDLKNITDSKFEFSDGEYRREHHRFFSVMLPAGSILNSYPVYKTTYDTQEVEQTFTELFGLACTDFQNHLTLLPSSRAFSLKNLKRAVELLYGNAPTVATKLLRRIFGIELAAAFGFSNILDVRVLSASAPTTGSERLPNCNFEIKPIDNPSDEDFPVDLNAFKEIRILTDKLKLAKSEGDARINFEILGDDFLIRTLSSSRLIGDPDYFVGYDSGFKPEGFENVNILEDIPGAASKLKQIYKQEPNKSDATIKVKIDLTTGKAVLLDQMTLSDPCIAPTVLNFNTTDEFFSKFEDILELHGIRYTRTQPKSAKELSAVQSLGKVLSQQIKNGTLDYTELSVIENGNLEPNDPRFNANYLATGHNNDVSSTEMYQKTLKSLVDNRTNYYTTAPIRDDEAETSEVVNVIDESLFKSIPIVFEADVKTIFRNTTTEFSLEDFTDVPDWIRGYFEERHLNRLSAAARAELFSIPTVEIVEQYSSLFSATPFLVKLAEQRLTGFDNLQDTRTLTRFTSWPEVTPKAINEFQAPVYAPTFFETTAELEADAELFISEMTSQDPEVLAQNRATFFQQILSFDEYDAQNPETPLTKYRKTLLNICKAPSWYFANTLTSATTAFYRAVVLGFCILYEKQLTTDDFNFNMNYESAIDEASVAEFVQRFDFILNKTSEELAEILAANSRIDERVDYFYGDPKTLSELTTITTDSIDSISTHLYEANPLLCYATGGSLRSHINGYTRLYNQSVETVLYSCSGYTGCTSLFDKTFVSSQISRYRVAPEYLTQKDIIIEEPRKLLKSDFPDKVQPAIDEYNRISALYVFKDPNEYEVGDIIYVLHRASIVVHFNDSDKPIHSSYLSIFAKASKTASEFKIWRPSEAIFADLELSNDKTTLTSFQDAELTHGIDIDLGRFVLEEITSNVECTIELKYTATKYECRVEGGKKVWSGLWYESLDETIPIITAPITSQTNSPCVEVGAVETLNQAARSLTSSLPITHLPITTFLRPALTETEINDYKQNGPSTSITSRILEAMVGKQPNIEFNKYKTPFYSQTHNYTKVLNEVIQEKIGTFNTDLEALVSVRNACVDDSLRARINRQKLKMLYPENYRTLENHLRFTNYDFTSEKLKAYNVCAANNSLLTTRVSVSEANLKYKINSTELQNRTNLVSNNYQQSLHIITEERLANSSLKFETSIHNPLCYDTTQLSKVPKIISDSGLSNTNRVGSAVDLSAAAIYYTLPSGPLSFSMLNDTIFTANLGPATATTLQILNRYSCAEALASQFAVYGSGFFKNHLIPKPTHDAAPEEEFGENDEQLTNHLGEQRGIADAYDVGKISVSTALKPSLLYIDLCNRE